MRLILNIIWLVLAGFWLALSYTIPFGLQASKLASFALWPFGRTVVRKESAGAGSAIGNVIWVILAGWWLALEHLVTGVLLAITIIGLPLAFANFKMIGISSSRSATRSFRRMSGTSRGRRSRRSGF